MTNVFYWYDNFTIAYVHPLAFLCDCMQQKRPPNEGLNCSTIRR